MQTVDSHHVLGRYDECYSIIDREGPELLCQLFDRSESQRVPEFIDYDHISRVELGIVQEVEVQVEDPSESFRLSVQVEHLRLEEGFLDADYMTRFGVSFFEEYKEQFQSLKFDGLLVSEDNRVHCTDKGMLLLDRVLISLF